MECKDGRAGDEERRRKIATVQSKQVFMTVDCTSTDKIDVEGYSKIN